MEDKRHRDELDEKHKVEGEDDLKMSRTELAMLPTGVLCREHTPYGSLKNMFEKFAQAAFFHKELAWISFVLSSWKINVH